MKRRTLPALVVAVLGLTLSLPANASAGSLTGAGSTLVAPLMARWAADFQSKTGNAITYGAVGSGSGIQQITARTVDFGASDAPMTPSQFGACGSCVQIPWAVSATAASYNIPGVHKLRLTGKVLSQIYLGQITNWNDKRIKKLNPRTHLPNLNISVVFRSDGSGDTYAFCDYLSKVSKTWKQTVGVSTSVQFPTGTGASGNSGVTAAVKATQGSIGYISAAYLIAQGLPAVALKNKAGNYEYPNIPNIQAAANTAKPKSNNEIHVVDPPKSVKTAYPLSTFTYAIVAKSSPNKSLLQQFILYAMTKGQKFGPALDFAKIPANVLKKAKKTAANF